MIITLVGREAASDAARAHWSAVIATVFVLSARLARRHLAISANCLWHFDASREVKLNRKDVDGNGAKSKLSMRTRTSWKLLRLWPGAPSCSSDYSDLSSMTPTFCKVKMSARNIVFG